MYWQNTNSHRVPFLVSAYCYITISTSKITHEKMMLQCTGEKCTLRELVQGQYWLTYVHVYFQGRQSLLVGSDKRTLPNWENPQNSQFTTKNVDNFPNWEGFSPCTKKVLWQPWYCNRMHGRYIDGPGSNQGRLNL